MSYQVEISSSNMSAHFFLGWDLGDVCITGGVRELIKTMPGNTWFIEKVLLAHAQKLSGNENVDAKNLQDIALVIEISEVVMFYSIEGNDIMVVTNVLRNHTVICLEEDDYDAMGELADLALDLRLLHFMPDFMKLALCEPSLEEHDSLYRVQQIISDYAEWNECGLPRAILNLSVAPFYEIGWEVEHFTPPINSNNEPITYSNSYLFVPEIYLCDLVNSALYGETDDWWQEQRVLGFEDTQILMRARKKLCEGNCG